MTDSDLKILVLPTDDHTLYRVVWAGDSSDMLTQVLESYLDLIPFMVARQLVEHGYNPDRELIVRLQGSDRDLACAPLGVLAATPLPNHRAPVKHPTRSIYRRERAS